jgi:hypothetical protein
VSSSTGGFSDVKQGYMKMDTNDQVRLVLNLYFN